MPAIPYEKRKEVADLYAAGHPIWHIMNKTGVGKTKIIEISREFGLSRGSDKKGKSV